MVFSTFTVQKANIHIKTPFWHSTETSWIEYNFSHRTSSSTDLWQFSDNHAQQMFWNAQYMFFSRILLLS